MISRRQTRRVTVGAVAVGGDAPIAVQSMTNTDTRNPDATLAQIARLADAGCEIVRVAIPHADALPGFAEICAASPLPVVADIHFDHRLAIEATRLGAAKLRINPGNIGSLDRVDAVIEAAGAAGIPVRIGVNAGSLATEYQDRDWPLAQKLFASAVSYCEHISGLGFEDIVVSAKASSVNSTIEAYRLLTNELPYPLHIGVTEAGTSLSGTVKSSVGLGVLLAEGIGDTLRVSLTADPVEEVIVGWEILSALDIRRRGPELVSCPTCGRCEVDMVPIAQEVERRLRSMRTPVKVAVMGCAVNGPGEARDADVGVASGRGVGLLFRRGEVIRKVPEAEIVDALMAEVEALDRELRAAEK
ncbi:MAG: 4-hydroxy-3-methylbut-2-en-1-yl diphosphate synthase [Actinobacteria bacterium HGW-Actinobacteria-6]|jgi:(E)-4-hydroxy-3-methylbut-2-enyl-diphosphate synthase|nr:MAG: 4-hydroxy-3-methylbut-2-en-1-yl diphosphate synthase [Actinobacteria bacterium HGW-Actinobacteria-6]